MKNLIISADTTTVLATVAWFLADKATVTITPEGVVVETDNPQFILGEILTQNFGSLTIKSATSAAATSDWSLDTTPSNIEDDDEDFDDEECDDDDNDDLFEETRQDIKQETLLNLDTMTVAEIKEFIAEQSLTIKTARLRKAELIAAVRAAMEAADEEESQPEPAAEPTMVPNRVADTWADFKTRNPHIDSSYVDRWVEYYQWAKPSQCLAWFHGDGAAWAIAGHREAYDALRSYLGR